MGGGGIIYKEHQIIIKLSSWCFHTPVHQLSIASKNPITTATQVTHPSPTYIPIKQKRAASISSPARPGTFTTKLSIAVQYLHKGALLSSICATGFWISLLFPPPNVE